MCFDGIMGVTLETAPARSSLACGLAFSSALCLSLSSLSHVSTILSSFSPLCSSGTPEIGPPVMHSSQTHLHCCTLGMILSREVKLSIGSY